MLKGIKFATKGIVSSLVWSAVVLGICLASIGLVGCEIGQPTTDTDETFENAPAPEAAVQENNGTTASIDCHLPDGQTDSDCDGVPETLVETTPAMTDENNDGVDDQCDSTFLAKIDEAKCPSNTYWLSNTQDGSIRVRCNTVCTITVKRVFDSGSESFTTVMPGYIGNNVELDAYEFTGWFDFPVYNNSEVTFHVEGDMDKYEGKLTILHGSVALAYNTTKGVGVIEVGSSVIHHGAGKNTASSPYWAVPSLDY